MAKYTLLRNGSSGADVKKLQQKLVDAGYDVGSSGVDGIYGNATAAAVRKYQKDNGLDVDGIAGDQTLGKLYGVTSAPSAQKETVKAPAAPTTTTPSAVQYGYDPSSNAAYQQALAQLQQAQGQKPTYQGTYDQQIRDMYEKIAGREKFSYDLNGDVLYQQYKNQYAQQGQMAMMDTMGQAAALTGGYGSSYGQSVGQQAYQGYLQQLNDVIPELYGMALDQYNAEGDRMVQQFGMLGDMADTEYGRYQDDLAQYWQSLAFQQQQADDAYTRGFNEWQTAYQNQYQAGRDQVSDQQWQQAFDYQQGRDQVADQQWQKEFNEAKRQYDQQYALQKSASSDGSSSGGGSSKGSSSKSSSSGGGYDNGGLTSAQVKALQKKLGVTADGYYGANSKKAAGGLSAAEAYKKYVGGSGDTGGTGKKWSDYSSTENAAAQKEKGGSYYADALADLKTMKKAGKSNTDAAAYLQEMLGNSLLTPSEYSTLYNKYRNNGL